jgi:hypothetical protein
VYNEDTRLAFVSCHLAARATRLRQRRENFEDIVAGLKLGGHTGSTTTATKSKSKSSSHDPVGFLHQFHHVFWVGDLNYRVNLGAQGTPGEFSRCLRAIKRGADGPDGWRGLLRRDQLAHQMLAQRAFATAGGFRELPVTFKPTYRYCTSLVLGKV